MLDHQTDPQHTPVVPYTPVPYHPLDAGLIEKALTVGDVSKMTPEVRVHFYRALCASCGLNPLTRPFILLETQSGELTWYATVGAAEQLRKLYRVSTRILSRERTEDGLYIVTVEASTPDGRVEQAQGIVPLAKARGSWKTTQQGKRYFDEDKTADGEAIVQPLHGTELANALHKAESKAKRRVTLAICGLGMAGAEEESGQVLAFDPQTGNIALPPPAPEAAAATLLTTVGQWFRQRPSSARETIAQGAWGVTLHEMPHLSQEALEAGWRVIDEGFALLDWDSPTLEADLAAWRQAHAAKAIADVFGEEGSA